MDEEGDDPLVCTCKLSGAQHSGKTPVTSVGKKKQKQKQKQAVISAKTQPARRRTNRPHVDMLSKPRQKVSKTTVFPHDPFLSPQKMSGYASLSQDDSLTTSFQELNQSTDNEELDRRKQKRGKRMGHAAETTATQRILVSSVSVSL